LDLPQARFFDDLCIIGSLSHIPYGHFAAALMPVAIIGLMITSVLIALSYRSEFFTRDQFDKIDISARYHGPLLAKSVVVMAIMVVLFFFGQARVWFRG
jgi:Na+/H+ antiporter NhaD/arsenite permease-like protein